jgi:hypothetical protein
VGEERPRSRAAREVAEAALVAVAHRYGTASGFVLLGGLVPELLCATSSQRHVGTSDVDVHLDLETALGPLDAGRLEDALRAAGLAPDDRAAWRWVGFDPERRAAVTFELLADLDTAPAGATVRLPSSPSLAAINVRGTGLAVGDAETRSFTAAVDGHPRTVAIAVAGLGGFLLAKCAAARARRAPKDWYDVAFVLLHNDAGGVEAAAEAVRARFGTRLAHLRPALDDLVANFADPAAQGPRAYAAEQRVEHPDEDPAVLAADAVLAVERFHRILVGYAGSR